MIYFDQIDPINDIFDHFPQILTFGVILAPKMPEFVLYGWVRKQKCAYIGV